MLHKGGKRAPSARLVGTNLWVGRPPVVLQAAGGRPAVRAGVHHGRPFKEGICIRVEAVEDPEDKEKSENVPGRSDGRKAGHRGP